MIGPEFREKFLATHRGYTGWFGFDSPGGQVRGRVGILKNVVTFRGSTVSEARKAFEDSVDDYLASCEERGEEPEKPVLD